MQALLLVDLQNDFMPGGALAVPQGDRVVAIANAWMPKFQLIVATQDWHPADHLSFASQHPSAKVGQQVDLDGAPQVLWPDHCIQESTGAAFHSDLNLDQIDHVVHKGMNRHIDSYSTFFDNARRHDTGLAAFLRGRDVDSLTIMGLATEYCVKYSVLDARALGFQVHVVRSGCRAVDLAEGDGDAAFEAMRGAGADIIT